MEGRNVLRRAQSLRSVSNGPRDTPTWAKTGFRDRIKSVSSVSLMVARYQVNTSEEASSTTQEWKGTGQHRHPSPPANEKTETPLVDSRVDRKLEAPMKNNKLKEKKRDKPNMSGKNSWGSTSPETSYIQPGPSEGREKSLRSTSLARSKSMSSLHGSSSRVNPPGGIGALKALFESKVTQGEGKSTMGAVGHTPSHPKMATTAAEANSLMEEESATPGMTSVPAAAIGLEGRLTRSERRKTISHFDLDKTSTASPDCDKRRSITDFRDSSTSFNPESEKPPTSVYVRAISAFYLSKIAAAESTTAGSSSPGKRGGKTTKMAEDGQKIKYGPASPSTTPSETPPSLGKPTQTHHASPTPPSKEALSALYQQRQKVELRRILKHTHPELRSLDSLDGVVDQELAEVLSSETLPTVDNTGYEGEVLSRRWIFENCIQSKAEDPHASKMHMLDVAGVGAGAGAGDRVGAGAGPAAVFGDDSGARVGAGSEVRSGFVPGIGSGFAPGIGAGVGSGFGPGIGPEVGSGFGPGIGAGVGSGFGPGIGAGVGSEFGPGIGPEVGSEFRPGIGAGVGSGFGPGIGAGVWGDVKRTSVLFEQPLDNHDHQEVRVQKTTNQADNTDAKCEEMMERMDVQSARRLFESQQVNILRVNQDDLMNQNKVIVLEDERGAVQKRKQAFEKNSSKRVQREKKSGCYRNLDVAPQSEREKLNVSANVDPEVSEAQPRHEGVSKVKQVFERKSQCASKADARSETSPKCPMYQSTSLFKINPFRTIHISGEPSYLPEPLPQNTTSPSGDHGPDSRIQEDMLALSANVRNRAQLFESTLFDLINHQNREEGKTVCESINDTLNSLYHFSAIHSHGSIIEASETGNGKRARYRLTTGLSPEVEEDQVAEGGVKNFILQLLPRGTLKPQLVYLKEDEQGNVEVTTVTVPVHQVHLASNQDKEFRTANVVQLIEDILSQDSSLRKGVVIQEDAQGRSEVTVYSLYNHFDGKVERYRPPQGPRMETNIPDMAAGNLKPETETPGVYRDDVKSTISCLLATSQDHKTPDSYKQEANGNVKLFKSCIERGDLEYLKSLQVQPDEEEQLPKQTDVVTSISTEPKTDHLQQQQTDEQMEQYDPDSVPVDVNKPKSMFPVNQKCVQQKEITHSDIIHSAMVFPGQASHGTVSAERNVSPGCDISAGIHSTGWVNNQSLREMLMRDAEVLAKTHYPNTASQETSVHSEPQKDQIVLQADLVEAMDEDDEISNLQAALYTLQQATMEAKALQQVALKKQVKAVQHVVQEKQQLTRQTCHSEQQGQPISLKSSGLKAEKTSEILQVHQKTSVQKKQTSFDSVTKTFTTPSSTSEEETATCCKTKEANCVSTAFEELQTPEAWSMEGHENTEVVQKGHLIGAMKNLQSSSTEKDHKEEGEVGGQLQAAFHSLEKTSGVNFSKRDFKDAMIYKKSGKSKSKSHKRKTDVGTVAQQSNVKTEPLTDAKPSSSITISEGQGISVSISGTKAEKSSKTKFQVQQTSMQNKTCCDSVLFDSFITSEKEPGQCQKSEEVSCAATSSEKLQNPETWNMEETEGTEVVQKGYLMAAMKTLQSSSTEQQPKEEVVGGHLQAALHSLEKTSGVNISQGDFKAAMIYKNSGKSKSQSHKKKTDVGSVSQLSEEKHNPTEPPSIDQTTSKLAEPTNTDQATNKPIEPRSPDPTTNKPTTDSTVKLQPQTGLKTLAPSKKKKKPVGPKPALPPKPTFPPKPNHLKADPGHVTTGGIACQLKETTVPTSESQIISMSTTSSISTTTISSNQLKEPNQGLLKEPVDSQANVSSKCKLKQSTKYLSKDTTKNELEESAKNQPNESSKDQAKESTKNQPKGSTRSQPKQSTESQQKESTKSEPKDLPKRQLNKSKKSQSNESTENQFTKSTKSQPNESSQPLIIKPMCYADALCRGFQHNDSDREAQQSRLHSDCSDMPAGSSFGTAEAGVTQHAGDPTQHAGDATQHAGDATQHAGDTTQHAGDAIQRAADPNQHTADTTQYTADPTQYIGDATQHSGDPTQHTADTTQYTADPTQHIGDATHTGDATQHTGDATQHTGDETRHTGDATQHTGDATQHTDDATQYTADPTQYIGVATQHTGDATQHTGDATQHTADTTQYTADTTQHIGDATQHTGDATQFNEDVTLTQKVQGLEVIPQRLNSPSSNSVEESNTISPQKRPSMAQGTGPQCGSENTEEISEDFIGFQAALQNFGGKKGTGGTNKSPQKPKRGKTAKSEAKNEDYKSEMNSCIAIKHFDVGQQTSHTAQPLPGIRPKSQKNNSKNSSQLQEHDKKKNKVVMREKKGKTKPETEGGRRQRLSIHMDEIIRGNGTTAMEIVDNLRKQDELNQILTQVKKVEEDTSQVDVRALRNIFENVPEWVVAPRVKKQHEPETKVDQKVEKVKTSTDDTDTLSSMALVFGDLERASEEIMNLKEQTLARLIDIEEAIKKALYSVSTLKSDSDIAGLSCLLKESLQVTSSQPQGLQTTSNISTLTIGSSTRALMPQAKEVSPTLTTKTQREPERAPGAVQRTGLEVAGSKPQSSPPSPPAFISIQSAARKKSASGPDTESLQLPLCSACQLSPTSSPTSSPGSKSPVNQSRQVSVLQLTTAPDGSGVVGTKSVSENYGKTDEFGHTVYSTKTTTVVTTLPDTRAQVVTSSPTRYGVVTYPEVKVTLPINKP